MSAGVSAWTPTHTAACGRPLQFEGKTVSVRVHTDEAGIAVRSRLVTTLDLYEEDCDVPDDAVLACPDCGPRKEARHYRRQLEDYNARFDRENPPRVGAR